MEKELNNKTRIKLRWHLWAVAYVICLQRKRWYGWKNTSWIYPSMMQNKNCKEIENWLFWDETVVKLSEKKAGEKIMAKCEWN